MKVAVHVVALPALLLTLGFAARTSEVQAGVRPVSGVVSLLNDMKAQLEKEQKTDEEVYEKLACWCETNDKAKTKSIADAEAHLANLEAVIEKATALSATLNTEITSLQGEIDKNQKSLDVATALRKKQLADFNEEEKEMVQSIQSLGAAVIVLSKHHPASFLEVEEPSVAQAVAMVQAQLQKNKVALAGAITPSQRRAIMAMAQADPGSLDRKPSLNKKFVPQSGEIFGILKQMKETFETNLADSQREEKQNAAAYEELKAAKLEEIKAGETSLEEKKEHLADTDEKLVQAKGDEEDTQESLSADEQFLLELKSRCSATDSEWTERQTTRQEEITAISKAISILHGDDARDLFTKTYSFGQLRMRKHSTRRDHAAAVLMNQAKKTHNQELAALAVSVQLDAFTRVKAAIDTLVTQLETEGADEITHRDSCISNFNTNELQTNAKDHKKQGLEATVATLKVTIKGLTETIATLNAEITELGVQRQRAVEDRAIEHKEFAGVLQDQKEAQALLHRALGVLREVYGTAAEAAASNAKADALENPDAAATTVAPATTAATVLMQVKAKRQEPPEGFKEYRKQGSTGVVMLIEQVISDTKELQAETEHAEKKALEAHTTFLTETDAAVQAKQQAVVDRTSDKSTADGDLIEKTGEFDGVVGELETLATTKGDLRKSCDYYLKNFEVRQEARNQEIEALNQAKAFLSGQV